MAKAGPKLRMLEWVTSTPLARECGAHFGEAIGARRAAFCEHCQELVLNLSAMTRVEAELRLLNAEKVPCIAFTRDESGEVSFAPDLRRSVSDGRGKRALALLAAATLPLAACHAKSTKASDTVHSNAVDTCGQAHPLVLGCAEAPAVPPPENRPSPMAGVLPLPPPDVIDPKHAGTLDLKSSILTNVRIERMTFMAPKTGVLVPEGKHQLEIVDAAGNVLRTIPLTIKAGKKTTLKLG